LKKRIVIILIASVVLSLAMFLGEYVFADKEAVIWRNSYGEGDKLAEYEVTVDGEKGKTIEIEVGEREYSHQEIQKIFEEVMEKLDEVVLGENESFDRVEQNLNLVSALEDYPVHIEWQMEVNPVINLFGEIQEEHVTSEGTLVELRASLSYREEEAIYVQHANVYPVTRKGIDKVMHEIEKEVKHLEEGTRGNENFELPTEWNGQALSWTRQQEHRWYYVLILGIVISIYLVYHEHERIKKEKQHRVDELLREYPGMMSKLTMLLSTGTTVRSAWEKIVQNYERQKESMGTQTVYEEMLTTLREMQGGVPEAECYERFGKRCGVTTYVKFGTLLSQNLRKGSKGVSDILRMEAIQSFENRKSTAKRLGEEAGTKLLMPMLGMLAVVFIIVMIPAFLSMQL